MGHEMVRQSRHRFTWSLSLVLEFVSLEDYYCLNHWEY